MVGVILWAVEAPEIEYVESSSVRQQNAATAEIEDDEEEVDDDESVYAKHRDTNEYLEFQSPYEHEDEPVVREEQRRSERRPASGSNASSYQSQSQRGRHASRQDAPYEDAGGSDARGSSTASAAAKDAQAFLRKQTEQAYDFAKKISMEDAKKGASETAKKAKKWGGSLLSSISASISSATGAVKVRP